MPRRSARLRSHPTEDVNKLSILDTRDPSPLNRTEQTQESILVSSANISTPTRTTYTTDVGIPIDEKKEQTRREAWEGVRKNRCILSASFADAQRLSREYVPLSSRQSPEATGISRDKDESGWRETTNCQTRVLGVHTFVHGTTTWQEFHGAFEHVMDPGSFYLMDRHTHAALMAELSTMEMQKGVDPEVSLRTAWEKTMMNRTRIREDGTYVGPTPRWRKSDQSCVNGGYRWWRLPHSFVSYDDLVSWENGGNVHIDIGDEPNHGTGKQSMLDLEADLTAPDMHLDEDQLPEDRDQRRKEMKDALEEGIDRSKFPKINASLSRVFAPLNPTDDDVILWINSEEGRKAR